MTTLHTARLAFVIALLLFAAVAAILTDQRLDIADGCKRKPDGPGLIRRPPFFCFVCTDELLCSGGRDPAPPSCISESGGR